MRSESPQSSQWLARLQGAILAVFLVMCLVGFQLLATGKADPQAEAEGGSPLRQVITIILLMAGCGVAAIGLRRQILFAIPPSMVLLLAWMAASILWAVSPDYSLRRTALAAIVLVLPLISMKHLGAQTSYRVFGWALGAIVAADLVAVALWPEAVHSASEWFSDLDGMWRGLHRQKNHAGAVAAALLIVAFAAAFHRRSLIGAAGICLAVTLLAGSQSKTSIGVAILAIAVALAFTHATKGSVTRGVVVTAVMAAIAAAAVIVFAADQVIWERFWNPENFTGRMEIWRLLLQYSYDHFWLGSGFGSFWRIGAEGYMLTMATEWAATAPHGHNGYLDLQAEIGFIGLVLAVHAFAISVIISLARNASLSGEMRFVAIGLLTFFLLRNFFETGFFSEYQTPLWALAASIARFRPDPI